MTELSPRPGGGGGALYVDTLKNNRARTVPLVDELVPIVDRWGGEAGMGSEIPVGAAAVAGGSVEDLFGALVPGEGSGVVVPMASTASDYVCPLDDPA
jgi:hypothetical protein